MMSGIDVLAVTEPGSAAEALVSQLVETMIGRYAWRAMSEPPRSGSVVTFVGADTVASAAALLARLPEAIRTRAILVGVQGTAAEPGGHPPLPGEVLHLLENSRAAASVPRSLLHEWRPRLGGFLGRKDLMGPLGTNCFKAFQSDDYCDWASTPGDDLFEFLARFVEALLEVR